MTARIPPFYVHALVRRGLAAGLIATSILLESVGGATGASTAPIATTEATTTVTVAGTSNTPSSPTNATVDNWLVTWLNRDRIARGLRPLRVDPRLTVVATDRAGGLSSLGVLSHTAVGSLGSQLGSQGVQYYSWGEDLGWSTYSWGYDAAKALYAMWRNSPSHWALMMSTTYNYVGAGLGYRWADHATYGSLVFTESRDHTRPGVRMTGAGQSGSAAWYTWRGADVPLQTHTAGLRNFDVEYRVDLGTWKVIRSGTTATSIRLSSRHRGHTYWIRVRARDRAGNVSGWSRALHVTIA
jgi:uncharacterized protein YkwD